MIPRILPRTRPRRLILLCGLVPTIVVAALSLYRPSVFGSFESGVYDRLLRSIPSRPTSESTNGVSPASANGRGAAM
jgi:hypothetical protein